MSPGLNRKIRIQNHTFKVDKRQIDYIVLKTNSAHSVSISNEVRIDGVLYVVLKVRPRSVLIKEY